MLKKIVNAVDHKFLNHWECTNTGCTAAGVAVVSPRQNCLTEGNPLQAYLKKLSFSKTSHQPKLYDPVCPTIYPDEEIWLHTFFYWN